MKILLLNWKDHHHPLAGGAEQYTLNILSRLAKRGHEVIWFTSTHTGARPTSCEQGINFVRVGSYRTVHGKSRAYLRGITSKDKPDVIVDEVNTRPFNPSKSLQVRIPVVNLIHQLARDVWFEELAWPVALLGRYVLEDWWLRAISRHPTICVSESTAKDLRNLGFRRVGIVHNAVGDYLGQTKDERQIPPLLLFVGRLSRGKKPKDALEAYRRIREGTSSTMQVVGTGPLEASLKKSYPEVQFLGHVSDEQLERTFKAATLLLTPGTREGWGRVVLQAQAHGVVPLVYDIPGLRDAVDYGRAGVLLSHNSPTSMADAALRLLCSNELIEGIRRDSMEWSKKFNWKVSTDLFELFLTNVVNGFIT